MLPSITSYSVFFSDFCFLVSHFIISFLDHFLSVSSNTTSGFRSLLKITKAPAFPSFQRWVRVPKYLYNSFAQHGQR